MWFSCFPGVAKASICSRPFFKVLKINLSLLEYVFHAFQGTQQPKQMAGGGRLLSIDSAGAGVQGLRAGAAVGRDPAPQAAGGFRPCGSSSVEANSTSFDLWVLPSFELSTFGFDTKPTSLPFLTFGFVQGGHFRSPCLTLGVSMLVHFLWRKVVTPLKNKNTLSCPKPTFRPFGFPVLVHF